MKLNKLQFLRIWIQSVAVAAPFAGGFEYHQAGHGGVSFSIIFVVCIVGLTTLALQKD